MKERKGKESAVYLQWPFIILYVIAAILLFTKLDDRNIGVDETWTVIFAENILVNGYPLITNSYGFFQQGFVPWFDSWLSYYLVAAFYAMFGISPLVSRLPFVLASLGTLVFFSYFVYWLTRNKRLAFLSSFLLSTSYLFYLHGRQSRYFSLVMFLVLVLVYIYLQLLRESRKRYSVGFIIINTIFFYIHFQIWAAVVLGIALHFLFFSFSKKNFKKLAMLSAAVIPFFIPFFYYWAIIGNSLGAASGAASVAGFFLRLVYGSYYFFILLFPLVFLLFWFHKRIRSEVFLNRQYYVLYSIIASSIILPSFLGLNPLPEPRKTVSIVLPLVCLLIAHILLVLSEKKKLLSYGLLILLIFSNLVYVLPLYPLKLMDLETRVNYDMPYYSGFIDRTLQPRSSLLQFLSEISVDYESIHDSIFPVLQEQGLDSLPITIYTDLDRSQISYQAGIRELPLRFKLIEPDNPVLNASAYLLNYEPAKRFYPDALPDYSQVIIHDYQETVWQDSTNPVYRRYKKDEQRTMLLLFNSSAVDKKEITGYVQE